ncbi:MAG: metallophosphoesterase, partial [Pseudobdellovibrio sp.]
KSIPYKYYITGNHEYIHGGSIWETKLKNVGFEVLHNTHDLISYKNARLMVAGVPDKMLRRFGIEGVSLPDVALKTNEHTDYKILLAHQPSSVNDIKTETCDLILSGHTHGGQIFPFHLFVRMVQPVVAGFKTIKNINVFAHQGTGLWGPPMRWFSRSEIVVFKWK